MLICSSTYTADIHDYEFSIEYKYKNVNDSIIPIGFGSNIGEEWDKENQLIKVANRLILKACTNCIYISENDSKVWKEYCFSPEEIEKDSLWIAQKIESELHNFYTKVKIEKIERDGTISLNYHFRKANPTFFSKNDERTITYKISQETGEPKISKISE